MQNVLHFCSLFHSTFEINCPVTAAKYRVQLKFEKLKFEKLKSYEIDVTTTLIPTLNLTRCVNKSKCVLTLHHFSLLTRT